MIQSVHWVIFVLLVVRMVRAGFFGPPRLFTWPMFSRVSHCLMRLRDQHDRPINPWQDIVHQDPGMNARELACYLAYLREVRGVRAEGTVTLVDHVGRHTLTVRDGHVVA
ncbi:hypothetical protein QQG74_20545 [Micromonospora sp. FIMYZ51]|uniref:hypothetical protein n=1 Tax=Micromonospora sp. FIMYZ51 TaxID=3051832 RepID=UPI00311EDDEE